GLVYGAAKTDPYFFREDAARTSAPTTNVERSLLEVEAFLRDFADDSPHVNVTLLRFANVLGDDLDTPFAIALRRPVVPEILGFDPRVQLSTLLTNLSAEPLRLLRLWDLPPEALQFLRYGRTLDNSRYQQAGFT